MKTVHVAMLCLTIAFSSALLGAAFGTALPFRRNVAVHDFANEVSDASVRHAEINYFANESNNPVLEWRFAGGTAAVITDNGRRYMVLSTAPYDADGGMLDTVSGVQFKPLNQFSATEGATCGFQGLQIVQTDFPNADYTYVCCKEGSGNVWVKGYCHPDGG